MNDYIPGSGGGYKGVDSIPHMDSLPISEGGTQTSGYAIGQGQAGRAGTTYSYWWGAEGNGGSGGSGYIGNSQLFNKVMYCFHCSEPEVTDENYASIKTITTNNYSNPATSKYAKLGDGHARITYLPKQ